MGRMLEALNRSEVRREALVLAIVPAQPGPDTEPVKLRINDADLIDETNLVESEPAEAEAEKETASYIEVGGPRSQIDASPDVLAAPVTRRFAPVEKPAAPSDGDQLDIIGTTIWCSWTLRPGVKAA